MRVAIFVDGTFIPERDGASTRFSRLPRELVRQGIHVVVFHCYRGWSSLAQISQQPYTTYILHPESYYSGITLMRRILAEHKIQILQFNDPEPIGLLGFPLSKATGARLVYEAHYHTPTLAASLCDSRTKCSRHSCETLIPKHVDRVFTFTDTDRDRWIRLSGVDASHVRVVPFGTDLPSTSARNPSVSTAIFVGNCYFEPNARAVAIACSVLLPAVRRERSDAELLIAGDVPTSTRDLLRAEGIKFCGEIADLDTRIQSCAFGVAPVLQESGIRVKLLRYLANGIPALATPAAAEGLRFPLLFVEEPWEGFVKRWLRLLNGVNQRDSNEWRQAAISTRVGMEHDQSWAVAAKAMIAEYEALLCSSPPRWYPTTSTASTPMWMEEILRKGRFKGSTNASLPKGRYGRAQEGGIDLFQLRGVV